MAEEKDEYTGIFSGLAPRAAPEAASSPEQFRGVTRLPKMYGHQLATASQNLLGLPGAVQDLIAPEPSFEPRNALERGLQKVSKFTRLPTGNDLSNFTGLGMEHHPELTPETGFEKYSSAAVRALPNAAAIMATGGGAAPALAVSGGAEFGAEAAHDLAPDNSWLPVVGGLVGSLTAGSVANKVSSALQTSAAQDLFVNAERALKATTKAMKSGKLSMDEGLDSVRESVKNRLRATQQAGEEASLVAGTAAAEGFEQAAQRAGKSVDWEDAGASAQALGKTWRTETMPKKLAEAEIPVNKLVPGKLPTPLSTFDTALGRITGDAGSLQKLSDLLTPRLAGQLQKTRQAGQELESLTGTAGVPPTWAEVRTIRSKLGEALGDPTLIRDIGKQNIAMLYRAISDDLTRSAKKVGAGEAWKNYNEESTRLYNFAGGTLSKVLSATGQQGEEILPGVMAKRLLDTGKLDATDLAALRAEIPEAANELAAVALRQGPGMWKELGGKAREALVPGQVKDLDRLVAEADEVTKNAAAEAKRAKRESVKEIERAQRDTKRGKRGLNQKEIAAREKLEAAAAKLPPAPTQVENLVHTIQKGTSAAVGSQAMPFALEKLGLDPHNQAAMAAGMAAGWMLPALVRESKNLVKTPAGAMAIPLGVNAGQNALAPGSKPPQ